MIVMSFDLSSVCTGVVAVNIEDEKIKLMKSCPVIPPKFSAENLGYLKSKRKVFTSKSEVQQINSYIKPNEHYVSKTEKKKRDVEVRRAKDLFVLKYIGDKLNELICGIKPDIIMFEKTEIFNGILTSVLLAKIGGLLIGLARSNKCDVIEIKVKEARKILPLTKIIKDFTEDKTDKELLKIPDITKRALRVFMENKYKGMGLKCSTDDESDSVVVFNFWYETIFKNKED